MDLQKYLAYGYMKNGKRKSRKVKKVEKGKGKSAPGMFPGLTWYAVREIIRGRLYACSPSRHTRCSKTSCFLSGGPCALTRNKEAGRGYMPGVVIFLYRKIKAYARDKIKRYKDRGNI